MQFPGPVRAVVGLLANAADEAKHLPDRAVELPMLAVSTALQMSLRAQQRYARLAARGEEVLSRRPPTEEPPPWATFDDPAPADDLHGPAPVAEHAPAASDLLDDVLGEAPADNGAPAPDATARAATTPPVEKTAPEKAAAKKAPVKKAPAKKAPAKKAPAKQAPAKQAARNSAADGPAPARGKSVSRPRHTAPSRFDTVDDE